MPDDRLTPAMRQYAAFKKQHPDCVLFFRMGDFYEMFYDDAVLCHKVLGLTLTQRTEGVPMAGVPYQSVERYLRRMIEKGYRVAVAEQVQDPKEAKGVVDRAVTRVVTAGTRIDETLLDDSRSNHIAAVLFTESGDQSAAAVAMCEFSTGLFELFEASADRLADELTRLGVDELVYAETATGEAPARVAVLREALNCALTGRPAWHFRQVEAVEAVARHFGVSTLAGWGLSDDDPAVVAGGALLRYLADTQAADGNKSRLAHIRPPKRRALDQYLTIDATSHRSLEIERTMRGNETDGSLLGVLRHCVTPMGRRLLRHWLCFPLRDIEAITRRQDTVQALIEDRELATKLGQLLGGVQDVGRIAGRMTMGRATPRDLVALGRSLSKIENLIALLDGQAPLTSHLESLNAMQETLVSLATAIREHCVEEPPPHLREGGLIRDGVDQQLDEARSLQRDAHGWLSSYQQRLIGETNIASLKVGFNRVFGYYIEVSTANSRRVPDSFTRKQTLKNAERYITPELKDFETKILSAEQRALEREQALFADLCGRSAKEAASINAFAEVVAELDVLQCFAQQALRAKYVRPTIVTEPILDIRLGRHPVLDELLRERFVPNDCTLAPGSVGGSHFQVPTRNKHAPDCPPAEPGANGTTLALITGPNMAGKSTYIRQIALIALLAHTGSFVPAEAATIGLVDRIFTRIGANDELHLGRSTFMVEMTETANILHHATPHSLIILDEIGRGTSTLDGLSLAWAIAEHLAKIGARTLFATHYHELTSIADEMPDVTNLHVAVREWAEEIIFLYRILPGRTDRSYGIHVAKIAGLPGEVIQRARVLLDSLEVQTGRSDGEASPSARSVRREAASGRGQMSLFKEYIEHPIVDELRRLDMEALSPIEAFDRVRQWRQRVEDA